MDYKSHTIDEFLSGTASDNVIPAGGTAAAVVGAIGASLCEMVCIHTVEKGEYANVAADVADLRDEFRSHRGHLLELADTDAKVIDELFPMSDGETDQSNIKRSIGVPLTIAETCLNVIKLAIDVTEIGNRNAVADAGTGVFLAHSALRASVFTARSNVDQVSDPSFVDDIERRATEIERDADDACERVMRNIEERS